MMHGKRELMALHIYVIIIFNWEGVDYYLDFTFSFSFWPVRTSLQLDFKESSTCYFRIFSCYIFATNILENSLNINFVLCILKLMVLPRKSMKLISNANLVQLVEADRKANNPSNTKGSRKKKLFS